MKIQSINKERDLFLTDDGIEYPIIEGTDLNEEELNEILSFSEEKVKEIIEKYG